MTIQDFINTTGISESTLSEIFDYDTISEEFTLSNLAEIGIFLEKNKDKNYTYV